MNRSVIAAFLLTATACSNTATYNPAEIAEQRQDMLNARNDVLADHLESVPDWVLAPPKPDGIALYAIGIGSSDDLNLAMKKSKLEAEFGLAKLYSQEISGNEKSYLKDQNDSQIESYTAIVEKLVKRVPIVGYSVEKQEIVNSNGKYNSYILLRMPHEQFKALIRQQKDKETSLEIAKAFTDLEIRLNAITEEQKASRVQPPPADTSILSQGL